jgi:uncharacterized protein
MDVAEQESLRARYRAAVDAFVAKVKSDPSVIAVIVCGSLAYDMIWEKSDIDMMIVIRDQVVKDGTYSVVEDGIVINADIVTRSGIRRALERSLGGSFLQSVLAKGTVAYSSDESFTEFFEEQKLIGEDDVALSVLHGAGELIGILEKAEKCLRVKNDLAHAQYYLLMAAEAVAHMELCRAGEPYSRRAIERALELHPEAVTPFYTGAMSGLLDGSGIQDRLETLRAYLDGLVDVFKKPVLTFMADQEIKTATVIARHFGMEAHFIVHVFEYLVEKGVIERVSRTIRPTPKGKPAVEEIGYLYVA